MTTGARGTCTGISHSTFPRFAANRWQRDDDIPDVRNCKVQHTRTTMPSLRNNLYVSLAVASYSVALPLAACAPLHRSSVEVLPCGLSLQFDYPIRDNNSRRWQKFRHMNRIINNNLVRFSRTCRGWPISCSMEAMAAGFDIKPAAPRHRTNSRFHREVQHAGTTNIWRNVSAGETNPRPLCERVDCPEKTEQRLGLMPARLLQPRGCPSTLVSVPANTIFFQLLPLSILRRRSKTSHRCFQASTRERWRQTTSACPLDSPILGPLMLLAAQPAD